MPTRTWATAPAGVAAVIESATYVVAASDSQDPARADYQCDGVADEVEINAAITALPAGVGGSVVLLEGTYTLAASIDILRDNVTLAGSGSGTVIQGAIAVAYIEVGNGATALTGITIKNLRIDGTSQTAGHGIYFNGRSVTKITHSWITECHVSNVDDDGIKLFYTEYTLIENNICSGSGGYGIHVNFASNNTVTGNVCNDTTWHGIRLSTNSIHNTVTGNTCNDSDQCGIMLDHPTDNTVTGNTCNHNAWHGIMLDYGMQNTVTGNTCNKNIWSGIHIYSSSNNTVTGNTCIENDVNNAGAHDGIELAGNSDENLVIGNVCNLNDRYGINISVDTCDRNIVKYNELIGNTTGCFNDVGTNTHLATKTFRFTEPINGSIATSSPTGISVTAATHQALTWGQLPQEVQQVVRLKVWAVALAGPFDVGGQMLADFTFNAGGSLEAYNLGVNSWAIASLESEETDYAISDVIHWVIEDADVVNELSNLLGGDSLELFAIHRVAADPDGETNAVFRVLEIEYV